MVRQKPELAGDPEACRHALERLLDRSRLELLVCDTKLRVQLASRGSEGMVAGGQLTPTLAERVRARLRSPLAKSSLTLGDGRIVEVAEVERAGARIFVWISEPHAPARAPDAPHDYYRLGVRERQLVRLLREGLTNREIAARLGLSEATVKTYLHDMYQALGVRSRTAALAVIEGRGDSTYFR